MSTARPFTSGGLLRGRVGVTSTARLRRLCAAAAGRSAATGGRHAAAASRVGDGGSRAGGDGRARQGSSPVDHAAGAGERREPVRSRLWRVGPGPRTGGELQISERGDRALAGRQSDEPERRGGVLAAGSLV